ncbi:MAG: chorismate synthase [Myxococcales bacterium]|nr:chorismate synthase [Myxococcales bacterium]USN51632.1 MAG: chorismate synthase [Myxococcales bacterium]
MATLRFLTAGESHGPKLTCIIEGLPAGFVIDKNLINEDLMRRQQGFGRGGRMKIEKDEVHISAGIVENKTTGAPVALEIINLDYKNWQDKAIEPMVAPRPGHADFAAAMKYHHDDLRLSLERASARETAIRTAAGSLCKQILSHFGIKVMAYVTSVGPINAATDHFLNDEDYLLAYQNSLANEFAFSDRGRIDEIKTHINQVMKNKDTLGGIFETVALGLIPGLGSYVHYDRKLDGIIAAAMMSIPAMKAVEIGQGIKNAQLMGTQVHDEFSIDEQKIKRTSNRAGGLEGGMTNGMPLVVRTYMKPISTTLTPRKSVDLNRNQSAFTVYERSDFCAVQRAAVIGEAVMSVVLLNALMDKIGGDHRLAMLKAFEHTHQAKLGELTMKKNPWRFNYDS